MPQICGYFDDPVYGKFGTAIFGCTGGDIPTDMTHTIREERSSTVTNSRERSSTVSTSEETSCTVCTYEYED